MSGQEFRTRRIAAGIPQAAVARVAQIDRHNLNNWEAGRRKFSVGMAAKVEAALLEIEAERDSRYREIGRAVVETVGRMGA